MLLFPVNSGKYRELWLYKVPRINDKCLFSLDKIFITSPLWNRRQDLSKGQKTERRAVKYHLLDKLELLES